MRPTLLAFLAIGAANAGDGNVIYGKYSFYSGNGNSVAGSGNVNIGFNSNLNGNGNWIVGTGHQVYGDGVVMFGPNADPRFYQSAPSTQFFPTSQYPQTPLYPSTTQYPQTTQYPTISSPIPVPSNQQLLQNNFNPFANQIVNNVLNQNRWSSNIAWPL